MRWSNRLVQLMCAGMLLVPVLAHAAEDDPWESINRPIFTFNDTIDTYALKPLAKGYQAVTPQFLEDGIHNFFRNIGDVGNLANDILQAKPHAAAVDTARLLMNTTIGVAGFFDVSTKMGLQRNDEDFGQTLGYWGVGSGPYVMLPFFGPSTLRDAPAKYVDSFTDGYRYVNDVPVRNSVFALEVVDTRASLLSSEKLISGDKYTFIRNAYLQNREFKVKDGKVEDDF
ncbi:Outer-membrane-phospholipid-binding lipoprotein MlaA [Pseudomonas chlororaphis subsp. aurantiaca]|jgi:phospholipid-binding lipoprotein MlaA|uniref:VacJ family lipoprotein n=1 Tax=Pseudomonas chlororaphis subsp. aurantiaca TaxID=86192 RepID=A0AAJ1E2B3_9PSED|nr:VacJ family lipoprotein [Pseudomonas chlororaphis]AIS13914.1 membrane protein [Pseudomonas chlororaphis subsp. aurantiaca]AZD21324.1 Outer-membrane-phospholipid-binding lipoprotein MlaA [Pseudomonas chlororaphis subsp. aurantiaca]AZD34839.1 Outer-membrane-phospholipid-binding lipoprotein MlaA [Pseudomonas chlororaphis subsp. aurantiaca]AZD41174.1 Outer-membrane-phospholipid-binding lipoprotein MlaA [Pseudomonas chlororaphis subsp. aurantiaca]AZD47455.1 Outer-membrane-phospholipid-binding li